MQNLIVNLELKDTKKRAEVCPVLLLLVWNKVKLPFLGIDLHLASKRFLCHSISVVSVMLLCLT